MVTGGWITRADRERWQRDAVRELAAILDAHPGLPLIAWAVGPSGGSLSGRIAGAGTRAALHGLAAGPGPGGRSRGPGRRERRHLAACPGRRGGVRISVTAMVPAAGVDAAVTS